MGASALLGWQPEFQQSSSLACTLTSLDSCCADALANADIPPPPPLQALTLTLHPTPQTLSLFDSVAADSGSSAQRANRLLLLMMWTFQAGSARFRVLGLELRVVGGYMGTIQGSGGD